MYYVVRNYEKICTTTIVCNKWYIIFTVGTNVPCANREAARSSPQSATDSRNSSFELFLFYPDIINPYIKHCLMCTMLMYVVKHTVPIQSTIPRPKLFRYFRTKRLRTKIITSSLHEIGCLVHMILHRNVLLLWMS